MILKIVDIKPEGKNCFSLILEKPQGFNFYPGQYLDVELPVKDRLGNSRTFTISSSPTEDFLMMTTKKGLTPFKKFMAMLKPADTITTSHPAGTFTLDESSPAVFIAGGIGITPFRSMIKYAYHNKLNTPITLLYSNSDYNFLFKKELENWQKQLPNLTIHYILSKAKNSSSAYIVTSQVGRLDKNNFLKLYPKLNTPNIIFYLAGPPSMVDDFERMLLDLGVDQRDIRYDRFDGY